MAGFTASKLADLQQGFAIPIRELMQNSLDASREAGNGKCEVNVFIESVESETKYRALLSIGKFCRKQSTLRKKSAATKISRNR